ncbi:MAG: hypothetical protein ABW133_20935 [Polyangiaceae bacterium]
MQVRHALVFTMGLFLGCGSDGGSPVDFTGTYTGTSTNGASTCPGTWTTGQVGEGSVKLLQSGDDVQLQAEGGTAAIFAVVFGSAGFSGKASGNHLDAVVVGAIPNMTGDCTYTWKGSISANLTGNVLKGTLTYSPNITGGAACVVQRVTGCTRLTEFSFTRPTKQP